MLFRFTTHSSFNSIGLSVCIFAHSKKAQQTISMVADQKTVRAAIMRKVSILPPYQQRYDHDDNDPAAPNGQSDQGNMGREKVGGAREFHLSSPPPTR